MERLGLRVLRLGVSEFRVRRYRLGVDGWEFMARV